MEDAIEKELPSGAKLYYYPAPFSDAKALYQAVLLEARSVGFTSEKPLREYVAEIILASYSSPLVEKMIEKCWVKCLYDKEKVSKDVFEPINARQDYVPMVAFIMENNIMPFLKGLFAEFKGWQAMAASISPKQS